MPRTTEDYSEIQNELRKITRRRTMGKKGGKPRTEQLTLSDVKAREKKAVEFLHQHGFRDFIPEAGMYFDGERMAHVTYTEILHIDSWIMSVWIQSEISTEQTLERFSRELRAWEKAN